mmetsp:Transcript_60751/g.131739  ORF Transcript_60751/g.131739 Transcript_60751/m.131739 type:complete len:472 (+) Transcript_60751:118-1533(+)
MILHCAPAMLPSLLDGLVWRSSISVKGMRRVNYYLKHLLVAPDGGLAKAMEWAAKPKDTDVVCHPILICLSELVWSRLVSGSFFLREGKLILKLLNFILSQAVLEQLIHSQDSFTLRVIMFSCRCLNYTYNLGSLLWSNGLLALRAYRSGAVKNIMGVKVPIYLQTWQDYIRLLLALVLLMMLACEPFIYCMASGSDLAVRCSSLRHLELYSALSMVGMYLQFSLLLDLGVANIRILAFLLVGWRLLSEVGLFLLALLVMIVSTATALSCLHVGSPAFHGVHGGAYTLLRSFLDIGSIEELDRLKEAPHALAIVHIFLAVVLVILCNTLIAQISCSYERLYSSMLGFACLKRIETIVHVMPSVSSKRWSAFVNSLGLDQPIEFNAGDVGLAGGIQITELATLHPTPLDGIHRYGGATSPSQPWPIEQADQGGLEGKFDRIERLIEKKFQVQSSMCSGLDSRGPRSAMHSMM